MSSLVETAQNAVVTLLRNDSQLEKSKANSWLQDFLHSEQSWPVYIELVSSNVPIVAFFAAQTFANKVRLYWDTLSPAAKLDVRNTMLNLCMRFSVENNHTLRHHLCRVLAVIGARSIPDHWPNIFGDLFQLVTNPPDAQAVVNIRISVLEILRFLPEELEKSTLPRARAMQAKAALESQLPEVMKLISTILLSTAMATDTKSDLKMKQAALESLLSWCKFTVTLKHLVWNNVFDPLFDFLTIAVLAPVASDILVEVLTPGGFSEPAFRTASSALQTQVSTNFGADGVAEVLAKLVKLRPIFSQTAASGSETGNPICRSICQLISGFGEVNLIAFAPHIDSALVQEFLAFAADCTMHPKTDIAELTLPFWRALQKQLNSSSGSATIHSNVAISLFERVLGILLQRAAFPPDFAVLDEMELEFFFEFRSALDLTLRSVYDVLGESHYLQYLHSHLTQQFQLVSSNPAILTSATEWIPIEALFFCVSVVAAAIPPTSALLAQFAQAAFSITTLAAQHGSTDRMNENLISILLNMFAQCAGWMKVNQRETNILDPACRFVTHFLDHPSIHLVGKAAAQALKRIFSSCQELLIPMLKPSVDRYLFCFNTMRPEDRLLVVQGFTEVIYRLNDLDQVTAALFSISSPTVALLKAQMNTMDQEELKLELQTLAAVLFAPPGDQIAQLVEQQQKQHPVVAFLQYGDIWQVLLSVQNARENDSDGVESSSSDEEIIGELYAIYGNILKSARKYSAVMLSSLFERIGSYFFNVRPTAAALELITVSLSVLKEDASLAPLFTSFLQTVAQNVFSRLDHLEPYLVAAFLECAATALVVNPLVLIKEDPSSQTGLLAILFQLSVRVLVQQNSALSLGGAPISEAVQRALQFIDSFLFGAHVQQSPDWQNLVVVTLNSNGLELVRGLLRAATLPGLHKQVSQVLINLLSRHADAMKMLVSQVLETDTDTLPADIFPPESRRAVVQAFFTLGNPRRFTAFIKDLADVCNLRAERDVLLSYLM